MFVMMIHFMISDTSPCAVMNTCEQICTDGLHGWDHSCSCKRGFLQDTYQPFRCFVEKTQQQPYVLVSTDWTILV